MALNEWQTQIEEKNRNMFMPTTNLSSSRNRFDAITPSFELVMQYSKQMKTIRMTNQTNFRQFSFVQLLSFFSGGGVMGKLLRVQWAKQSCQRI